MVDWNHWIYEKGVDLLKTSGVQPGDNIIEFGSGIGDYTLPAAILIESEGANGKITAIDEDGYDLDELKERVDKLGLNNIEMLETRGDLSIEKENEVADVVLVFDVLHYFNESERATLYGEIYRVLNPDGKFITFPQHYKDSYPLWNLSDMELSEIIDEIEFHHFKLQNKWRGKLIHDHDWYNGIVLTFKKETR